MICKRSLNVNTSLLQFPPFMLSVALFAEFIYSTLTKPRNRMELLRAHRALNMSSKWEGEARAASAVALELQEIISELYSEFVREDGTGVDYEELKQSPLFQDRYLSKCKELQKVDLAGFRNSKRTRRNSQAAEDEEEKERELEKEQERKDAEKKCFFLNIYNVLTIHGLASQESLPDNVLHVKSFWKKTMYNIGGVDLSLDDIEHGILRANRY